MEVIMLPRGQGKTTELVKWISRAPDREARVGVFLDERLAMWTYREMGGDLESWQFVSLDTLRHQGPGYMAGVRRSGRYDTMVYGIDDADVAFARMLGERIAAITVST